MSLLIDGYNVLYVVGILGEGQGPGSLERSRLALLNFLVESLDPEELTRTVVVFDAHNPPPGLPRESHHRGLSVRFAAKEDDADTLIEELILADSSPRQLTVVSSDHRIQRAAHRRRARAVDSDVWYGEVIHQRRQRREAAALGPERPNVPLLAEDVDYWVRQFGGAAQLDRIASGLDPETPSSAKPPVKPSAKPPVKPPAKPPARPKPSAASNHDASKHDVPDPSNKNRGRSKRNRRKH
jgi:predicted RNA-binding protein with PIN domain